MRKTVCVYVGGCVGSTAISFAEKFDEIHIFEPNPYAFAQLEENLKAYKAKIILQNLAYDKGIFLGEFVKALLKINNISCEMEKIAEMTGNIAFLSKLREIPNLTLKYVVTNQSLYV